MGFGGGAGSGHFGNGGGGWLYDEMNEWEKQKWDEVYSKEWPHS